MNSKQSKNNGDFKMNDNWDAQSRQLKSDYPQLTDSDLKCEKGKEEELVGRLESRLNKDRNTVMGILNKGQSEKRNQNEKHNL